MLIKPENEMNLEQLRSTQKAMTIWLANEANPIKRNEIAQRLNVIAATLKRRKRR